MASTPSSLNVYQGNTVVVSGNTRITKPDYNVVIDAEVRQLPDLNVIDQRMFDSETAYDDWAINRAAQP